eukprot:549652-Prymnesium_polylepis.1
MATPPCDDCNPSMWLRSTAEIPIALSSEFSLTDVMGSAHAEGALLMKARMGTDRRLRMAVYLESTSLTLPARLSRSALAPCTNLDLGVCPELPALPEGDCVPQLMNDVSCRDGPDPSSFLGIFALPFASTRNFRSIGDSDSARPVEQSSWY